MLSVLQDFFLSLITNVKTCFCNSDPQLKLLYFPPTFSAQFALCSDPFPVRWAHVFAESAKGLIPNSAFSFPPGLLPLVFSVSVGVEAGFWKSRSHADPGSSKQD